MRSCLTLREGILSIEAAAHTFMDVSKLGWASLLHRDIHNCFNRSSFQLVFTIHTNALVGTIKILCPPNVDGAKRSKSSKATSLSWRRSTGDEWKLFLCHYWQMTTPLLFLRQFLNPSKVEEYLQLVEKTQGVEIRFCNLVLADRDEVTLPVGVWFMLTMKHFCAYVLMWWAS